MRCSHWAETSPQKSVVWVIGCIGSVLLASSAMSQPPGSGFRAFELKNAQPAGVEQSLREFLDDSSVFGEPIDIVADARGSRLLVRGSQETQRLAEQFVQAVDQPAAVEAAPTIRPYAASSVAELEARAAQLRQQYAARPDVKITTDERSRQLIVQAPAAVHAAISQEADSRPTYSTAQAPSRRSVDAFVDVGDSSRRNVRLQHINWQELVRGLQTVTGVNNALTSSTDGKQVEMSVHAGDQAPVGLLIDQATNRVELSGERGATDTWAKVIEALDVPRATNDEQSRVVSLDKAAPASITRAVSLASGKLPRGLDLGKPRISPPRARWGGDIVTQMFAEDTDGRVAEVNRGDLRLAQAPDQLGAPQNNPAAANDMLPEGTFLGPVSIEFLDGLDMLIVKGAKNDVDRVLAIINDIERLSQETQPKIEVYHLEHANSDAIGTLVTQLNESILTARYGEVSVTSLVKPNAILLIGRPETVDSTIELIKKLDKEVEPSTQFKVFQLKHTPSVDVERTISNLFIAERTGLATRVSVVADFRTNAIVVYGSPRDLEEITKLIEQIDVPSSATESEVKVFKLQNAIAQDLVELLNTTLRTTAAQQQAGGFQQQTQIGQGGANTQPRSSPRSTALTMVTLDAQQKKILETGILTDVTVAADQRVNSLVVTAPRGSMDLISELVRQLDQPPTAEVQLKVFTIERGDASALVEMLETLFTQSQQAQQGGPAIQSAGGESSLIPLRFSLDQRTNSIIASGSKNDLEVVYSVLLSLDASDVSARKSTVYRLENSPADEVATAITTFLQSTRDVLTQVGQQTGAQTFTPFEQMEREVVVVPELNSNSLIISATERFYDEIIRIVKEIDRRPELVMIQVLIAEVQLGTTEQLGVELGIQDSLLFDRGVINTGTGTVTPGFNFNNSALGNSSSATSLGTREKTAGQALSNFALGRTDSTLGYGGLVLSASSESINVLVRALQASQRLDVLSRPQVMTMNNQTALVEVGSLVPYITGLTLGTFGQTSSVTQTRVGLSVQVTPRVTPDNLVVMQINATKSELGPVDQGIPISVTAAGDVIRSPVINQTVAQTVISAQDGQTVILGGLITKRRTSTERKVPYLGDVPLLGRLFRFDAITDNRTELLIIMTPHVVRSQEDLDTLNSDEYARMSWCMADAIELHGDLGSYMDAASNVPTDVIYSNESIPTTTDGTLPYSTETFRLPESGQPAEALPSPSDSLLRPSIQDVPQGASLDAEGSSGESTLALAAPKNRGGGILPGFLARRANVWDVPEHQEVSKASSTTSPSLTKPGKVSKVAVRRFDQIPMDSGEVTVSR